MEYLVGTVLAIVMIGACAAIGIARERSFFATMTIVVASYYVLFAAMAGSGYALVLESVFAGGFFAAAAIGFRRSLWVVAVALAGHGLFDLVHPHLVANPGVPHWWLGFCSSFDVTAGGLLAALLVTRHRFSVPARGPSPQRP